MSRYGRETISKPLKIIGIVAGVVAVVASGGAALGLVLGGTMTFAGISAATIATVASVISAAATIGSQQLAKPPPARGSVTQILVQPDAPQPYVMGEGYFAGVLRHDTAYGATLKKVPNPYRFMAIVYSGGGPIESITPQIDFAAISGWFSGFLYTDTQLGACPETTALAPHWSGTPGWDSTSKLSGLAAIGWSLLFDKNGKVFANGVPLIGAYGQWVKVYDPRLDSTFPGGSGSHRLGDETTYEWSENPALHAGTYAYGRYQNGKRVMGMGLPAEGIDWNVIAAWANVCDANSWTMFGVVYEGVGPGESERRWDNLKDICFAGGAEPIAGGILTFKYSAPVVALDTITADDLTDDDCSVTTMQSFRDRINTVIPKYRSPTHNWELVDAEPVVNSTFLAEDGQEKRDVWPFNFVKDAQQATELAAYRMFDTREIPVTLVCKPRLRTYRPGECLHLNLPELGLDIDAIILTRQIDPVTMVVTLDLITETTAKHAYCLGLTGVAPPTPAIGQTSQERDELAAAASDRQVTIDIIRTRIYSADYTGTVSAPPLPDTITPNVTLGGNDIRTDDSVSYAIATSGVTASVNNTNGDPDKGKITITSVDALNGWIDLTVTVNGVDYPAVRIVIQKQTGMAPGFGGSGSKIAEDNSFIPISSTSFSPISDVLTVTLAGGEKLYGTAPLDYFYSGGGTRTVTAKWQYSPAGAGTWSDFDTGAITGSAAMGSTGDPGHGEFTDVASGLSAGDYDVQLVAKLNTSATSVTFTGTATLEAKV